MYLPALDGLRFVGFLLVFFHHLPEQAIDYPIGRRLHERGFEGVELFFIVSSFLFFYLLGQEQRSRGEISIARFYIRRLLRIYPLLLCYACASVVVSGSWDREALVRLAGVVLSADNVMIWLKGYNFSFPQAAHLWTLSYEFQIYLVIPAAFVVMSALPRRTCFKVLGTIALAGVALRMLVYFGGAPHPDAWVTPFLRPESVLLGIAISLGAFDGFAGRTLAVTGMLSALTFLTLPLPQLAPLGAALTYPAGALACGCLLALALRPGWVRSAMSLPPIRYLGSISFGLYIFHPWATALAVQLGQAIGHQSPPFVIVVGLAITVALAWASYNALEKPFLRLKLRYTAVDGRSDGSATQPAERARKSGTGHRDAELPGDAHPDHRRRPPHVLPHDRSSAVDRRGAAGGMLWRRLSVLRGPDP